MPTGPSEKYSDLIPDIIYEKGKNVELFTIKYQGKREKEFGIIKMRHSPYFNDFLEFEVEVDSIPLDDNKGKDVTMNFKMYDGFNSNGTFWTDSNGLAM